MTVPPNGSTMSVRGDIAAIVGRVQDGLGERPRRLLHGALSNLRRAEDYGDLKLRLRRLSDELDSCRSVLQVALDEATAAEAVWMSRERFGQEWWKRRRRGVEEAFRTDAEQGRRRWLETYVEALAATRFDVCLEMTLQDWPTPPDLDLLQTSAAALKEGRHRDAVEGLEMLAEASELVLDPPTRSAVLILLGRIYLYELANLITARHWIERALTWSPEDARAIAALGQCLRIGGELDKAREHFTRAIQQSPEIPDGYIGMAQLSEDRQWWRRALDWYDDGIEAAGESAQFGHLLAPVPGNLHWQIARRLRRREPERALAAIDRALTVGVRWEQRFPERRALADRAGILERLGRSKEAAASYFQAGRRHSWLGDEVGARPLLERACRLDPTNPVAHWQLSESLRVLSHGPTPPFLDEDLVQRSKAEWETGTALRRPDPLTAWAFLGRALLNDQRWKLDMDPELFWESLVFLESALLLDNGYATAWAYAGKYHGALDNIQNALHATEQALVADPTDVAGLEQRAAALARVGRYEEAEDAIDRRLRQAEEWWALALRAWILMRTGRAEGALSLLGRAVGAVPEDEAHRSQRALCLRVLDREEQAVADYRWIWERRDGRRARSWMPHTIARAGCVLGEYDETVDRIEAALQEPALDQAGLWCLLGQALLARGDRDRDDLATGERALTRGIELTRVAARLRDLVDLDIALQERTLRRRSGAEPALAILARLRDRAEQEQERLAGSKTTAEEELRALAQATQPGSMTWLATQASLARRAGADGRWSEALDIYAALTADGSFPEGGLGMARAVGALKQKADRLVKEGRVAEAHRSFQDLLHLTEQRLGQQAALMFELHLRAGLTSLDQGDDEAAHRHLDWVLSSGKVDGRLHELAALEQTFVRSPKDYWTHVDGLRRIQSRYARRSGQWSTLDALIRQISLSRVYGLAAADVDGSVTFPIATPLALRVGTGLEQADPEGHAELPRALKELRRRVESETGIRIPGVRLSETEDTGPGDYVILQDATPVAWGTLPPAGGFILDREAGRRLAGRRARDPLSGLWGVWVDLQDELAVGHYQRPLDFIQRHVEATIRRGMADFIGLDDIQAWLDYSPENESGVARIALPDRTARVMLSRVLQVLAREGVPVAVPSVVLTAMQNGRRGASVLEIAAAVRRQLRSSLPGTEPDSRRLPVPQDLEERLARGLHVDPGATYWELAVDETVELVDALRAIDPEKLDHPSTALVVRSGELRPFVWRLLTADFPYLSVLSEEELDDRE